MALRWTGRQRADHDRWVLLIEYIGVRHVIVGVRLWHLPPLAVRLVGRIRGAAVGTGLLRGRSPHSRGSGQCTHARYPSRRGIALRRHSLRSLVVRAVRSLPDALLRRLESEPGLRFWKETANIGAEHWVDSDGPKRFRDMNRHVKYVLIIGILLVGAAAIVAWLNKGA